MGRLRSGLDAASDLAVLAFALWTAVAYVGMATGWRVEVLVAFWLAGLLVAGWLFVSAQRRNHAAPEVDLSVRDGGRLDAPWQRSLVLVAAISGVVAALLAVHSPPLRWVLVWIAIGIAVVSTLAAGGFRARARPEPESSNWGDAFALAVALAFAVLALVVQKGNADDVFYVNRAAAVAELGHIPVLDVIFTHEEVARGGGAGLPVDSYSALQGAVAHVLGVTGGSVAYLAFPPLVTFLAVWALWRLLRAWTPRRALLGFGLGSVFWLFSAQVPLTSGSFFLTRIWQGKAAFVSWLVPTMYVYLTRWLSARQAVTGILLLAAGLSSIGMTGSATFAAPLLFLAALVPLATSPSWRGFAVPALAAAIPLVVGLVVLSRFPLSDRIGADPLPPITWFYHQVLGFGFVCFVASAAIWLAPWTARAGPPRGLTTGIALLTALLLAPGAIALLSDVSGLTETLRRALWLIPVPALVGLFAALPAPERLGRHAAVAATVVLAGLLVVFGHPLWETRAGRELWTFPPRWKVSPERLGTARSILAHYEGRGPILVRKGVMEAIAIQTAEPKTVNPRILYLRRTRLPAEEMKQRLTLTRFVMNEKSLPSDAAVGQALADLRVGLVCLQKADPSFDARLRVIAAAYRKSFDARGYVCLERRTNAPG